MAKAAEKSEMIEKKAVFVCMRPTKTPFDVFLPYCKTAKMFFSIITCMTKKKYFQPNDLAIFMKFGLEISFCGKRNAKAELLGATYIEEENLKNIK